MATDPPAVRRRGEAGAARCGNERADRARACGRAWVDQPGIGRAVAPAAPAEPAGSASRAPHGTMATAFGAGNGGATELHNGAVSTPNGPMDGAAVAGVTGCRAVTGRPPAQAPGGGFSPAARAGALPPAVPWPAWVSRLATLQPDFELLMKAFLIDPALKTITPLDLAPGLDAVRAAIGFATIDSDEIDDNGDRLFFDEECFIRALEGAGRFRVDNLAPVQGKGVIVGSGGAADRLADVRIDAASLARRVTFL